MTGRLRRVTITGLLAAALMSDAPAQEPDWSSTMILPPGRRAELDEIDVRLRPYRPFHVYGNTVRRIYYRGNPLPSVRDFVAGSQSLMSNQPPPPRPAF